MVLTAVLGLPVAAVRGDVVAHWSFDSDTLTIDGGNITGVAEATGNHNATPGIGGTGGTGNQFISAPFDAATSSVPGRFGEALRFNGDNFLLFPQLTELMAANGAPSYTVSMWVNTAVAFSGGEPFSVLSNWGNEPAASGATRFTYAFGPGGATSMRGQTRFDNGTTNGGDIYARAATTPTTNDSEWHMLTWTFNTTSGVLSSYFDGALVDTFQSTAASFAMADSSSGVGAIGIKADNGVFLPAGVVLDEIWVFDRELDAAGVQALFTSNIPEPASLGLMGGGGLLLLSRRRRMHQ